MNTKYIKPNLLGISLIFTSIFITCVTCIGFKANANEAGFQQGDKPLPKWEVGGMLAGFNSPLYPSSKDSQNKLLAVPYVVYRGDTIRVGDGSIVKAMAIEAPRFKLDLSLKAAFNADSDESSIREGMPDLDFLFEVGPQFRFLLSESSLEFGASQEVWLNLQSRAVFSTDFGRLDHRGYVFQPQISWRSKNLLLDDTVSFASISPIWGTEKLHDYFFEVSDEYQTSNRQAFNAQSGYLGTKLSIGNIFQIKPQMSIFFAAQWGVFKNAKNDKSPLFEKDNNISAVIGIRYTFMTSDELI